MDWADRIAGDEFLGQRRAIRDAITNPKNPYYSFIKHIFEDVDYRVLKTFAVNFFINAAIEV